MDTHLKWLLTTGFIMKFPWSLITNKTLYKDKSLAKCRHDVRNSWAIGCVLRIRSLQLHFSESKVYFKRICDTEKMPSVWQIFENGMELLIIRENTITAVKVKYWNASVLRKVNAEGIWSFSLQSVSFLLQGISTVLFCTITYCHKPS